VSEKETTIKQASSSYIRDSELAYTVHVLSLVDAGRYKVFPEQCLLGDLPFMLQQPLGTCKYLYLYEYNSTWPLLSNDQST